MKELHEQANLGASSQEPLPSAARLLRLALARARLQTRVIAEISQASEILSGDVEALARIITERAALTVGCERVNVWLFDDDESTLRCIDDYSIRSKAHASGALLSEEQYRREFHALKHSRYVAADHPLQDPRTQGYADSYLTPLGITSMLDTVIQISGKHLGLLCFEHVGVEHQWQSDEIAFAEQLADKLGLALVSRARRAAEADLRASEEKFRGLVESSVDFIWELDEHFRYTYASPQITRLLGYRPEELLGRLAFEFMPAGEAERIRAVLEAPASRGRGFTALINRATGKDGRELILESSAVAKIDDDGTFRGYRGVDRDITERQLLEEQSREARQLLEGILNAIPVRVFWKDRNLVFRGCNMPFARDAGFTEPAQLVGKTDFDMGWREQAHLYQADDRQVIGTGTPKALIEESQSRLDGSTITLLTSKIPLRDASGNIDGVLGIYMDISERKRSEEALRRSAAELREAQRLARLGSWVWDPATDNLQFSAELYRIFGLDPTRPPPKLKEFTNILLPESYQAMMTAATRAQKDGAPYELDLQFRRDGGTPGWLLVRGEAELTPTGACKCLRGTALDITERKEAEEALAYRDRVLHAVTDTSMAFVAAASMEQPMSATLQSLAEALKLDRLMLMYGPNPGSRGAITLLQEWQSPSVPRVTNATLATFVDGLGSTWISHLAGRRILFNSAGDAVGLARELLEQLQIKSSMVVPIFVSGAYWGHIAADDCRTQRRWSSVEVDALKTLAEIVGVLMYREQVRASLQQSEERFRAVSETAQDAIVMIDAAGRIVYWNRAAQRSLGYTMEEALGRSFALFMASEVDGARAVGGLRRFTETGQGLPAGVIELTARHKDGTQIPVEISVSAMRLHEEWHVVAFVRDITERKRSETYIQHLARHDVLTGLANRRVFVEALDDAILRARRERNAFAVLYLDLDHFKDINDTLGHPVGDLVLKEVAARLLAVARETDTVARFGGDEFAILQSGFSDPASSAALAERVLTSLAAPMTLDGNEIRTGTSVGIAVYAEDNDEAEKLLSQADVALYRAKSEGRGTFRFFTESMDVEVHKRVRLGAELRQALGGNQLLLYYQPQVDVENGRIVGVEALTRWQHPERGMISPAEFIPVAEQTGLVVALGQWALREACHQAKRWRDAGITVPLMAVNLSGLQFKSPNELETHIASVLAESGLSPQDLELELTESILMDASQEHNDVLLRLRSSGFRLAIDDFGTGYSSLDYLRRFPVDRIKIAQNFITELTRNSGDAVIVRAALGIARELQIPAIVEGVETAEQLHMLRAWGCREVQGYYYSRPLPAEAAAELLRAGVIVPPRTAG